jgi:hypothetical protein
MMLPPSSHLRMEITYPSIECAMFDPTQNMNNPFSHGKKAHTA